MNRIGNGRGRGRESGWLTVLGRGWRGGKHKSSIGEASSVDREVHATADREVTRSCGG